jgi:hypothetical protein
MHPVKLSFLFNQNRFKLPQLWIKCPGVIDAVLEQSGDTTISFNVPTGIHNITIQLLNKTDGDTILQDGKIVDDLYVIIKDCIIDDISFTTSLNNISTYAGPDGTPLQTQGWISFSSPFNITLQTPGFLFKRNIATLKSTKMLAELHE